MYKTSVVFVTTQRIIWNLVGNYKH